MLDVIELQRRSESFYLDWLATIESVDQRDPVAAMAAVREVYDCLRLQTPMVIFCDSPWQMVMMRSVLQKGLSRQHMGMLNLEDRSSKSRKLWRKLWKSLEVQVDQPTRAMLSQTYHAHSEKLMRRAGFADGFELYSWHGVTVQPELITDPTSINVEAILAEANIEIRRVMVERFGAARFISETGAHILQRDKFGTLYVKPMPNDQPLVMVLVKNSTADLDGSYREFFLRVPPTTRTAREGVAWSFGLRTSQYHPDTQT